MLHVRAVIQLLIWQDHSTSRRTERGKKGREWEMREEEWEGKGGREEGKEKYSFF